MKLHKVIKVEDRTFGSMEEWGKFLLQNEAEGLQEVFKLYYTEGIGEFVEGELVSASDHALEFLILAFDWDTGEYFINMAYVMIGSDGEITPDWPGTPGISFPQDADPTEMSEAFMQELRHRVAAEQEGY